MAKATCSIDGCAKRSRSGVNPYCEMHYYRTRRHGDPMTVKAVSGVAMTSNGYVLAHLPNHPQARTASTLSGWVLAHRATLYDDIGPGVHPCHWCGCPVDWGKSYPADLDALVVDHLDEDKTNNDPSNLVPACNACNSTRGS